jgi:hypothetical protein
MISRRSILAATPALLIPKPGLSRHLLSGGSSSVSQFTPDGTEITYNTGPPVLHTAWGDFSAQGIPYFTTGPNTFFILLNGRPVGQTQNVLTGGFPPEFSGCPAASELWVDQGGNVYAFVSGDSGFYMYYNGWITSGDTGARYAPAAGYVLPNPPFTPGYTPSPDGTTITAPTASTVTTQDGVWGISGGVLTLNGTLVVDNRNSNNSGYPPNGMAASVVEVNSNGNLFFQFTPDSSWRSMAGLQANPSTGPTSSPVPKNLNMTLASGVLPNASPTAPSGTVVASLQMTLTDGSVVAPLTSEVTFLNQSGFPLSLSYVSPNLQTNGNNLSSGNYQQLILEATRNGTTFCLNMTMDYP